MTKEKGGFGEGGRKKHLPKRLSGPVWPDEPRLLGGDALEAGFCPSSRCEVLKEGDEKQDE